MCVKGRATGLSCSPGLVYNKISERCDFPEKVPECYLALSEKPTDSKLSLKKPPSFKAEYFYGKPFDMAISTPLRHETKSQISVSNGEKTNGGAQTKVYQSLVVETLSSKVNPGTASSQTSHPNSQSKPFEVHTYLHPVSAVGKIVLPLSMCLFVRPSHYPG